MFGRPAVPRPADTAAVVCRRDVLTGAAMVAIASATGCARGTQPEFRFSGIPDADKSELARRYGDVASYLTAKLGRPARYVHVPDYTAAVTALASGKIDAAWLGGVTAVQADQRTPGGVRFVAARPKDLEFRSYFVANRSWLGRLGVAEVSDRQPQPLEQLSALRSAFAEGTLSFGAKSSTSGHVMPRWFLGADGVGIDPETAFAGPPVYQLKGGHAATLRAVADGAVDFGVLNFSAWEAADRDTRAAAPVIYVTPHYVDYCFVARADLDAALLDALSQALVQLSPRTESQQRVLDAFSTDAFVPTHREQWSQIRTVLATLEAKEGDA